jgi:hypothetical protein
MHSFQVDILFFLRTVPPGQPGWRAVLGLVLNLEGIVDSTWSRPRLSSWVLPILLIATFVTSASADGLFGSGLSGLPFFRGSPMGYCGTYPECGMPTCPPGLELDIGYLWGHRGMTFDFDPQNGPAFGFGDLGNHFRYPVEGLQLGLSFQTPLKDDIGVVARGTWLVPSNQKVVEEFPITGVTFTPSREWRSKVQYYTLDAAAVYPFRAAFNVLAGFRFDSLSTDFKDPTTVTDYSNSLPTDRSELTFAGYIPYVGLGLNCGQRLRASLIGTPWLWGNLKFRETIGFGNQSYEWSTNFNGAYFLELSGEYGLAVGPGTLAVLARWNLLHAHGSPEGDFQFAGATQSSSFSMAVNRQSFFLGGSFNLGFDLPL